METIAKAAKTYLEDESSKKIDVASLAVNERTDEFIKHVRKNKLANLPTCQLEPLQGVLSYNRSKYS